MYQYHGWLSTLKYADAKDIESKIKEINTPYPASADYVNGELHISFSGSPNRDLGQVKELIEYLVGLKLKLSGCVYINDGIAAPGEIAPVLISDAQVYDLIGGVVAR